MAQTLNAKTTFVGKTAELRQRSAAPAGARVPIVVRAQQEETVSLEP